MELFVTIPTFIFTHFMLLSKSWGNFTPYN
jgi:hypothetical protein